ncbi:MAG: uracil-DNA glycosylase family protein [Victivallaceae bacterium]|nr:uracil-DNA glycosylase [Victivallaceae bacterium]
MPEEKDFYSEMTSAIAACPDAAAVSAAVWGEFCSSVEKEAPIVHGGRSVGGNAGNAPLPSPPPGAPAAADAVVRPPEGLADSAVSGLDWEELTARALACSECVLRKGCRQVVFGEGNRNAELMFVGEGPGYEEDVQGRPFVGPAGKLLDKMIAAMHYSREEVYIANVVKCRPPGNRAPEPDEAACCVGYLNRQIDLIHPKVLVLLGATPLKYLTGKLRIKQNRGEWCEYRGIRAMPTFHPAYLLRVPEDKRLAWSDLKQVMAVLGK